MQYQAISIAERHGWKVCRYYHTHLLMSRLCRWGYCYIAFDYLSESFVKLE